MRKWLWSVLFVAISALPSAAEQNSGVRAFTGQIKLSSSGKSELARLYLFPSSAPEQVFSAALLTLHQGSFSSPEYQALYYREVYPDEKANSFVLAPPDDREKLPIVRFEIVGNTLKGELFSSGSNSADEVQMNAGWSETSRTTLPILSGIEGYYEASCQGGEADPQLVGAEIFPSRIFSLRHESQGAVLRQINYLGNTLIRSSWGGMRTGSDLHSGIYDPRTGELSLRTDGGEWRCFQHEESLSCSTPIFGRCQLTRKARPLSEHRVPSALAELSEKDLRTPDGDSSATACHQWSGEFSGILHHRHTRYDQRLSLSLRAFAVQRGKESRCGLTGSATLFFGTDPLSREKLVFHLPVTKISAERGLQLLTFEEGRLILELVNTGGKVNGNAYSSLFGWIGAFSAASGSRWALDPARTMPSLTGRYRQTAFPVFRLRVEVTPGGFTSNDPLSGLSLGAWSQYENSVLGQVGSGGQILSSYDWFLNDLVLQTSWINFVGQVYPTGMELTGMGRSFLGAVNSLHFRRSVYERLP